MSICISLSSTEDEPDDVSRARICFVTPLFHVPAQPMLWMKVVEPMHVSIIYSGVGRLSRDNVFALIVVLAVIGIT